MHTVLIFPKALWSVFKNRGHVRLFWDVAALGVLGLMLIMSLFFNLPFVSPFDLGQGFPAPFRVLMALEQTLLTLFSETVLREDESIDVSVCYSIFPITKTVVQKYPQ